tara:strand:- start:13 stop:378 length:366 start_codon:yes stop_codon:yes gene_type:complete
MPYKKITLNNVYNTSLQVGDIAYYVALSITTGSFPGYNPPPTADIDDLTEIGVIHEIGSNYIIVEFINDDWSDGDFIMFSKNKKVNNTSLLGYYAEVKLSNNSTEKAELFALSSEVTPSSK